MRVFIFMPIFWEKSFFDFFIKIDLKTSNKYISQTLNGSITHINMQLPIYLLFFLATILTSVLSEDYYADNYDNYNNYEEDYAIYSDSPTSVPTSSSGDPTSSSISAVKIHQCVIDSYGQDVVIFDIFEGTRCKKGKTKKMYFTTFSCTLSLTILNNDDTLSSRD